MQRLLVRMRGRVQGVGFRYFVLRVARSLSLTGTVRNEADGSVCVEAQGLPAALEEFLQELREGHASARVDQLKVDPLEPVKTENDFTIRF
jgi:acylphosphatase